MAIGCTRPSPQTQLSVIPPLLSPHPASSLRKNQTLRPTLQPKSPCADRSSSRALSRRPAPAGAGAGNGPDRQACGTTSVGVSALRLFHSGPDPGCQPPKSSIRLGHVMKSNAPLCPSAVALPAHSRWEQTGSPAFSLPRSRFDRNRAQTALPTSLQLVGSPVPGIQAVILLLASTNLHSTINRALMLSPVGL